MSLLGFGDTDRATSPECSFPECHRQKQLSQVPLLYQLYPVHWKITWAPLLWHGLNWVYLHPYGIFLAEITFVDLIFSYQVGQMAVMILKFLFVSPPDKTNTYWVNDQNLSTSPTTGASLRLTYILELQCFSKSVRGSLLEWHLGCHVTWHFWNPDCWWLVSCERENYVAVSDPKERRLGMWSPFLLPALCLTCYSTSRCCSSQPCVCDAGCSELLQSPSVIFAE